MVNSLFIKAECPKLYVIFLQKKIQELNLQNNLESQIEFSFRADLKPWVKILKLEKNVYFTRIFSVLTSKDKLFIFETVKCLFVRIICIILKTIKT